MEAISSITDKPILKKEESLLNINNYAKALTDFIVYSSTPLTIGFQGEWGTGKTSLMNLVKEDLEDKKIATSWVNSWEYALFKQPEEITPCVLKGLLENLIETCKHKGWKNTQILDEAVKKVKNGLMQIAILSAQFATKSLTGTTLDINTQENQPREIADIKKEIQIIIDEIIRDKNNPVTKIVFFVDDLDRIDPPIAVGVLEALKNLFDIDKCVFILAIDYEVVVKGLENKFGKKTESNEREFRSFFDKIIQVPFTMPISAYAIDNLLNRSMADVGINIDSKLLGSYIDVVRLTVGCIPRSVKRFVNSFSLLSKIRGLGSIVSDNRHENLDEALIDFSLFVLIGIQISYPKIFKLFNKEQPFLEWDERVAAQIGVEVSGFDSEYELTDEKWEQILWCYCQSDPYYKARATSIIRALNILRLKINDNMSYIEQAMVFASMTSVDDDTESKDNSGKYRRRILADIGEYITEISKVCEIPVEFIELLKIIDRDLRSIFKDEINNESVKIQYTPTGGITYNYKKMHGARFLGISVSHIDGSHLELTLLRSPNNEYKCPEIKDIDVRDCRTYSLENGYKNLPYIEFYKISLSKTDDFNDEVINHIKESYAVRKKNKVLKNNQKKIIKNFVGKDD